MKKTILIVCSVLYVLACYGQNSGELNEKPTVLIDYFKGSGRVPFALVEGVRNSIIKGMQKMDRVTLIDIDEQSDLRIETYRRSYEYILEDEDSEMGHLPVMNKSGAQYILAGHVSSAPITKKTGSDNKEFYVGSITYTLKLINAGNGALIGIKTFQTNNLSGANGYKEEAFDEMLLYAEGSMRDFVDEYFKIEGDILEVNSEKKGQAKEVYISLGSRHGVQDTQKFTVYVMHEVAGRVVNKEIGRLTVKTVAGEDISLCKVQKGGAEIMDAIRNEHPIRIVSRKQTLLGGMLY